MPIVSSCASDLKGAGDTADQCHRLHNVNNYSYSLGQMRELGSCNHAPCISIMYSTPGLTEVCRRSKPSVPGGPIKAEPRVLILG